jgi:soluble lytic murein transglycosylase
VLTIAVRPAHQEVRAALLQGSPTARVDEAFAGDPSAVGAGFMVRRLERTDPAAACALVKTLVAADHPARTLALPRHVACLRRAVDSGVPQSSGGGSPGGTDVVAVVRSALQGPLGRDASLIIEAIGLVRALESLRASELDDALAPLLSMSLPTNEPARRAAAGTGLGLLALRGTASTAAAAKERLLDELPEQPRDGVVDEGAGQTRRRLVRAAVLERLQRNIDVFATVGDLVTSHCEAALLVAKAKRKLRQYASSREALLHATKDRCGDVAKKARYLELRVASIQKGKSVESLARSFLQNYAQDPLADDVLLWLAETRDAQGNERGRDEALERIVADFPTGDMADDARFRLAMARALQGRSQEALTLLDDAIAMLEGRGRPRPVDLDRAQYWRARLALAPNPRSLAVVDDPVQARVAWSKLAAFAGKRGASFYGQLARRLARTAAVHGAGSDAGALDEAGEQRTALAADVVVSVPPGLASDSRFVLALQALDLGFDDEAATLLSDTVAEGSFANDRASVMAMAAAFVTAGRPDRAHQTLRNAGFATLPGEPAKMELLPWTLAWPRAFSAALEAGAREGRLPSTLLTALAREESAFDPAVVSWAGALGLCQLMPTTALEEALALALPSPTTEALLDPSLNARLGGAHLGRRLRGLKHPLLAIAAYNAGPGAVRRWLPQGAESWPVDFFVEQIPVEETRNYVKKVTGSWVTYTVLDDPAGSAALDRGPLAFALTIAR